MPSVITHGLMANDVIQQLDENLVSKAISQYPALFFMGSNGPDFLFYYRYFSHSKDAERVRNIGQIFHLTHINDFYRHGFNYILSLEDLQQAPSISYLAGHLMHWVLDSIMHPYIFHRTGLLTGATRYDHYRFESMLDVIMATQVKKMKLSEVPSYRFVNVNKDEALIIAKLYQKVTELSLGFRLPLKKYTQALSMMAKLNRLMFDPTSIKTRLVKLIENHLLKDPYRYSSHFIAGGKYQKFDILNLKKIRWVNPCDNQLVSDKSVLELYDDAIISGKEILHQFNEDLLQQQFSLDTLLENRNYESGLNYSNDMQYFNLIFEHNK